MSSRKYLIPTLLVAGFSIPIAAQEVSTQGTAVEGADGSAIAAGVSLFRKEMPIQLAQHRSHRSHSSHSSHRSSTSGGYYSPAPVYTPPPPPPPQRRAQSLFSTPLAVVPVDDGFVSIVRRVQSGLSAFGYYSGASDGQVGPETRAALIKMQTDYGLKTTGTITPEVLKALSIEM